MSATFEKSMDIQRSSEDLLQQARDTLEEVDDFFREQGLDPDALRRTMPTLMTDEISAEISAKFAEVTHDIDRAVTQKRVELNLDRPAVASGKRPRPLV